MARTHRKLFPTLSTINQTQDCPDFCDPACPYNCYSFPDYNFPPPPPPPPSPSYASDHSSRATHISSYFIILVSLFSVIFVLLGFYVLKTKFYAHWCGRRHNGSPSGISNSDQDFLDQNQVDHPIWLITTIGLQQSLINSITVCKYKRGEGLIEGTECSVCLNDFREDETLRLLPKCNHAFHIPCIDTWLRSHTNCPLCRAGIVSNNVATEAAASNFASTELNYSNSRTNQEIQTENPPNGAEINRDMIVIGNGASGNRVGTGEAQDFTDDLVSKEDHHVWNDETEIGIRSMSMDARLSDSRVSSSKEPENQPMFKAIGRSSTAKCLHLSPISMKRSFSCSGRILSARDYRTNLLITLPY